MTAPSRVSIEPVRNFDADAPIIVDVPEGSTSESECSKRRTALSGHRTGLSEHRTALSENRTTLSTLRSHLSNERTHLSYLRTAISLIGFGTTLNRFAAALAGNATVNPAVVGVTALHDAKWVGFGMVVLGFALVAWALFRFHRTSRDIELRRYRTDWRAVLVVTGVFLALGIATMGWLFFG
jgi:putative membrane protein